MSSMTPDGSRFVISSGTGVYYFDWDPNIKTYGAGNAIQTTGSYMGVAISADYRIAYTTANATGSPTIRYRLWNASSSTYSADTTIRSGFSANIRALAFLPTKNILFATFFTAAGTAVAAQYITPIGDGYDVWINVPIGGFGNGNWWALHVDDVNIYVANYGGLSKIYTVKYSLSNNTNNLIRKYDTNTLLTNGNINNTIASTDSAHYISQPYTVNNGDYMTVNANTTTFGPVRIQITSNSVACKNISVPLLQHQELANYTITKQSAVGLTNTSVITNSPPKYYSVYISPSGAIVSSQQISAASFHATSDRRLKTNITPISSQLDNIKTITPCTFDWKNTGKADLGFIAQDVYRLYPDLRPKLSTKENVDLDEPVDETNAPVYYGLDYGKLTTVLWKGLQETTEIIETQKSEIDELKSQMKLVMAKLANV
jgi:hypothetical protein